MPAAGELEIRFTWRHANRFEMSAKRGGGGGWITVVKADENGHISELWAPIQQICETFMTAELNGIGLDMKAGQG